MSNTIDNIGDQATLDGLISHTLTEFVDDNITSIRMYAFYNNDTIKNISLPSLNNIGIGYAFKNCDELENVDIGNTETITPSSFEYCKKLKSLHAPLVTKINGYAFQNCNCFKEFDFSNITEIGTYALANTDIRQLILPSVNTLTACFCQGHKLAVADIGTNISSIPTLLRTYSLCHLIIRKDRLVTLSSSTIFNETPIVNGIGWIYVPSNLVESYKTASNWSNFANQIVSINEYPKMLQNETISDSWSDIIASINNNTYTSKYNVGDIKYCNIGGTYTPMQIVAFDTDVIEGGGVAPITFMSLGVIRNMEIDVGDNDVEWIDCELRKYLRESIYLQIEDTVRNAIKPVIKTYRTKSSGTLQTTDTIWIPSMMEMFGASVGESTGVSYISYFTDNNSRKKAHGMSTSNTEWWLRTHVSTTRRMMSVTSSGSSNNNRNIDASYGIVIGFCI